MNDIYKKIISLFIIFIILAGGVSCASNKSEQKDLDRKNSVGAVLDSYKGVDVYYNGGSYTENHGKNYSRDGYYYGYKWQCVEYIKRFYYMVKGLKMSDVYGNAKDFFDSSTPQGKLNKKRGLVQYRNEDTEKPKADDLLVFTDNTYGHVAIITEVGEDYIEVIQQNKASSREKFKLEEKQGKYFVGEKRLPAGWLRYVN